MTLWVQDLSQEIEGKYGSSPPLPGLGSSDWFPKKPSEDFCSKPCMFHKPQNVEKYGTIWYQTIPTRDFAVFFFAQEVLEL